MTKKTALITGASRGLGAVLAQFLAQQGYHLVLTARGSDDLQRLAETLRTLTTVTALAGDVANTRHQQTLADAASSGLDVLINNASDLGPSPLQPLLETPSSQLARLYSSNVLAPLALVQSNIDALRARQGLVINLSSDSARGGYESWGGYGSSKAALDLISLTLANELKAENISVVSVDPGDMRTAMHQAAFPDEDISDRPLPEVTLPFWAWLLGQPKHAITGQRFEAQAERWTLAHV